MTGRLVAQVLEVCEGIGGLVYFFEGTERKWQSLSSRYQRQKQNILRGQGDVKSNSKNTLC